MYKIKKTTIIIVSLIISICFFESVSFIFNNVETFRKEQIKNNQITINTYYDIEDSLLKEEISKGMFKSSETKENFELKNSSNQDHIDLIIKQNNANEDTIKNNIYDVEDYEIINNDLSVEFALSIGINFYDSEKTKRESNTNKTDILFILEAIENDKTYDDIFKVKNADKLTMYVPASKLGFDEKLAEQFLIILNNGNSIADENKDELEKRSKNILDKCKRIENMDDLISLFQSNIKEDNYNYIVMMPENYFLNILKTKIVDFDMDKIFFTHINNTTPIFYNIYVKNDLKENENKNIKSFVFSIQNNDDFSKQTNLRVENSNFTYDWNGFPVTQETSTPIGNSVEFNKNKISNILAFAWNILVIMFIIIFIISLIIMLFEKNDELKVRACRKIIINTIFFAITFLILRYLLPDLIKSILYIL